MNEFRIGFGDTAEIVSTDEAKDAPEDGYSKRECSRLYRTGGIYHRPNLTITERRIHTHLHSSVTHAQLRHVPSGAVRLYGRGTFELEPGEYVLSLHGSTYGHEYIFACVSYN